MWRLLDLGSIDGYVMTNAYEAVAKAVSYNSSPNTIILNHPKKPFVNIGYHQIMEKEIDLDYAKSMQFDLVRRSIGGGAILDGPWEQDYFIVIHRNSNECPSSIPEFYNKFLRSTIYALNRYQLDARLRPPNDIIVDGQKISGNGAVTVDEANVLAGDILLSLPIELMTKIMKTPSEKFRDKLAESMEEWLTSLEDKIGFQPNREEVKSFLIEGFDEELGIQLEQGSLNSVEEEYLATLLQERRRNEWIFSKDIDYEQLLSRRTKIKEGVYVYEADHKAGKLIRLTMVVVEEKIDGISISGDFFTRPYIGAVSKLEEGLKGTPLEKKALKIKIEKMFNETGLSMFGATQEELITAILKATEHIH